MKTRTVTRVVREEIPWSRIEGVDDVFKADDEINRLECYAFIMVPKRLECYAFITVPKGTRTIISVCNELADAIEEYEVETLEETVAQIQTGVPCKIIRKTNEEPL